jgi:fructose-1-phosphate kinase PfkB-like protein
MKGDFIPCILDTACIEEVLASEISAIDPSDEEIQKIFEEKLKEQEELARAKYAKEQNAKIRP